MKKLFSLILVALMVAGCLTACGGEKTTITSADYHYVYSSDIQNMDYVVTNQAEDHRYNANFVDGLLENDSLGNYVGCLAETWKSNDDASVWTFNIRKGVKWVTNEGEEYAEVTAHDWVTALQHAADFNSETISLVRYVIAGLDDYLTGKTTDFSTVGVKAVDDYTLEYTLTGTYTYFDTMTTYAILYPINKEFLESKGEGCKLGSPDIANCTFGSVDATSIAYNGGYILTNCTSKSVIEMTKNASYWDAEHVYINKLTWTFDDGSDPYSVIKGFEDGVYTYAGLNATWEDYAQYKEQYAEYAYASLPDMTTFNFAFNFNRTSFTNSKKDAAAQDAGKEAILNKNFRLACFFGFDRLTYNKQRAEEEIAKSMLRNLWTPPTFLSTSNGSYGALVQAEIAKSDDFADDIDVNDGHDAYYDPAKCLEYIDKAKAEGVQFPVTLDLVTYELNARMMNQAASLKNSLETASNGQILVDIYPLDLDGYYANTYYASTAAESDWDISTATGWGPDYMDPKTWLNCFDPNNGDMLVANGLDPLFSENSTPENKAAMEAIGLDVFGELLATADAITNDIDARYAAYAKADAFLITEAITLPIQCSSLSMVVSRIKPFTAVYSVSGISEYKFKFMQIKDEIATTAERDEAYNAWLKARG